jgi:hypothetical protein
MASVNFNINIDDLPIRVCSCGESRFIPTVYLREVSEILSPNGQAGIIFTDAGMVCATCGEPADLKIHKKEEENNVVS